MKFSGLIIKISLILVTGLINVSCPKVSGDRTVHIFDTEMDLNMVTSFEIHDQEDSGIYDDLYSFFLITNLIELQDFEEANISLDLVLPGNYFNDNVLVVYRVATFGAPIEDLSVYNVGSVIHVSYFMEEGFADCTCYNYVIIKVSLNNS